MKKPEPKFITVISVCRCHKCGNLADDPNNPETTFEIRRANDSWDGWLCKCGYYNGLDP